MPLPDERRASRASDLIKRFEQMKGAADDPPPPLARQSTGNGLRQSQPAPAFRNDLATRIASPPKRDAAELSISAVAASKTSPPAIVEPPSATDAPQPAPAVSPPLAVTTEDADREPPVALPALEAKAAMATPASSSPSTSRLASMPTAMTATKATTPRPTKKEAVAEAPKAAPRRSVVSPAAGPATPTSSSALAIRARPSSSFAAPTNASRAATRTPTATSPAHPRPRAVSSSKPASAIPKTTPRPSSSFASPSKPSPSTTTAATPSPRPSTSSSTKPGDALSRLASTPTAASRAKIRDPLPASTSSGSLRASTSSRSIASSAKSPSSSPVARRTGAAVSDVGSPTTTRTAATVTNRGPPLVKPRFGLAAAGRVPQAFADPVKAGEPKEDVEGARKGVAQLTMGEDAPQPEVETTVEAPVEDKTNVDPPLKVEAEGAAEPANATKEGRAAIVEEPLSSDTASQRKGAEAAKPPPSNGEIAEDGIPPVDPPIADDSDVPEIPDDDASSSVEPLSATPSVLAHQKERSGAPSPSPPASKEPSPTLAVHDWGTRDGTSPARTPSPRSDGATVGERKVPAWMRKGGGDY